MSAQPKFGVSPPWRGLHDFGWSPQLLQHPSDSRSRLRCPSRSLVKRSAPAAQLQPLLRRRVVVGRLPVHCPPTDSTSFPTSMPNPDIDSRHRGIAAPALPPTRDTPDVVTETCLQDHRIGASMGKTVTTAAARYRSPLGSTTKGRAPIARKDGFGGHLHSKKITCLKPLSFSRNPSAGDRRRTTHSRPVIGTWNRCTCGEIVVHDEIRYGDKSGAVAPRSTAF